MPIYKEVKEPVFSNAAHTAIDCQVLFEGLEDYVPFTAVETDCAEHGVEIFKACMAGTYGPVSAYIEDETAKIVLATATKANLLQSINRTTQLWQSQLLLGMIADDDKAKLVEWMKYAQKVQAVDAGQAEITWPDVPNV